jgi:hypothetical protein
MGRERLLLFPSLKIGFRNRTKLISDQKCRTLGFTFQEGLCGSLFGEAPQRPEIDNPEVGDRLPL